MIWSAVSLILSLPIALATPMEPAQLLGFRVGGVSHELRLDVVTHWDDYIRLLPARRAKSLTAVVVHKMSGVFQLEDPPTFQEFDRLARGHVGEIGLTHIRGVWYATQSPNEEVSWGDSRRTPFTSFEDALSFTEYSGLRDFDLHSHPGHDEAAFVPSFADADHVSSSKTGRVHIWTHRGILEISQPPGFKAFETHKLFWRYVIDERALNEQQYNATGIWTLMTEFFTRHFGMKWLSSEGMNRLFEPVTMSDCGEPLARPPAAK